MVCNITSDCTAPQNQSQGVLSPLLCEVHKVKKIWSYITWHDICQMRCLSLILIFFWPLIKLGLNFENKSIERLSPSTNHYHFLSLTPFSVSDYFLNIENENKYSCWSMLDFQSSVWCECGGKIMKASLFWQNRENVFQNIGAKLFFFPLYENIESRVSSGFINNCPLIFHDSLFSRIVHNRWLCSFKQKF